MQSFVAEIGKCCSEQLLLFFDVVVAPPKARLRVFFYLIRTESCREKEPTLRERETMAGGGVEVAVPTTNKAGEGEVDENLNPEGQRG